MSSTDSSLLSAASLLTANVIQEIYSAATGGKKISNRVGSWILKGNVLLLGVIATVIAIVYKSGMVEISPSYQNCPSIRGPSDGPRPSSS